MPLDKRYSLVLVLYLSLNFLPFLMIKVRYFSNVHQIYNIKNNYSNTTKNKIRTGITPFKLNYLYMASLKLSKITRTSYNLVVLHN